MRYGLWNLAAYTWLRQNSLKAEGSWMFKWIWKNIKERGFYIRLAKHKDVNEYWTIPTEYFVNLMYARVGPF